MNEKLMEINKLIKNLEKDNYKLIKKSLEKFLKDNVSQNEINDFDGDYPTIIEPVYVGKNVVIRDDVLLGPNVYIGENCEIGEYSELSNTILMDNVKIGSIIKLDNCIVAEDSELDITNLSLKNCILMGNSTKKEEITKISFD
ncbi:MAG: hypothetical protein GF317_23040 [Candidatus Lokiarchaeota archaeon]|nr:hypothetical protein [Candidatus Lokiarchaeota archaeon]MBD3202320.1 hypothetical protein [Candidatus Lokiarchaeota archaeon]